MPQKKCQSRMAIEIDARLAYQYRVAYAHTFGTAADAKTSIEEFIGRFVEDRLGEELAFVAGEPGGVCK